MADASIDSGTLDDILAADAWWRTGVADLQRWAATLPASVRSDRYSGLELVGTLWDGVTDIDLGKPHHRAALVRGTEIVQLLAAVRQGLAGISGTNRIGVDAVRTCNTEYDHRPALVVDVDMGDFILPLSVERTDGSEDAPFDPADAAAKMIAIVAWANDNRERIVKRELAMRRALEETTSTIGRGAAPLWLRLQPLPFQRRASDLLWWPRDMLMLLLDPNLVRSPVGSNGITTLKAIRDHQGHLAEQHRHRADRLVHLNASKDLSGEVAPVPIDEAA